MANKAGQDGAANTEGWTVRHKRTAKPAGAWPDSSDRPPGFELSKQPSHVGLGTDTKAYGAGGAGIMSLTKCKRQLAEASTLLSNAKAVLQDGLENIKVLRMELTVRSFAVAFLIACTVWVISPTNSMQHSQKSLHAAGRQE
jgi:hypothetical protein